MDLRKLTNAAMMTAIAVIMTLIGVYIPPLFVLFFLIPVPVAITCIRSSKSYAIASSFAVFIVNVIFVDIATAFISLFFAFQGLAMGYLILKKRKASETVIDTSIVSIFGIVIILYLTKVAFKVNVFDLFFKTIDISTKEVLSIYQGHPNFSAIRSNLLAVQEILKMTLPASILVTVVAVILVNYIIISKVLKTQRVYIEALPPFEEWKMPYITGWIFIGVLLYQYFLKQPEAITTNIIALLSLGFTLGGLAVVRYYLIHRLKMKSLAANLILVFLFLFPLTSWLLFVIGIVDTSMNLRKYMN
ncbi:YybS family protein [Thermoanaerobacter mathranii]|uniref:YybS family protein n=1 Tax=Thermoanaerobacter mathranii TaxID=583357 RepID=UPI003AAF7BBB